MLSFSLAATAVFLVVVNGVALARKGGGVGLASLCSLGGVVGFLCLGVLVLPLNALLVAVAGAVCWWIRARPRWFLAYSLGATVLAYLLIALPDLYAWNSLKKDYPLESLASRLAYEERHRTTLTSPSAELVPSSPAAHHLASLEEGVAKEEEKTPFYLRTQSLERLHAGVVQQFIDSPGFGVGRMMIHWPSPYRLEREQQVGPLAPIPQPTPPFSPADLGPAPLQVASELGFLTAHDDNTLDFLNPIDFGYFRDRDHVAGFRPHRFHDNPKAPERWRVNRLEMVGILKHDEPVVYLSANFPRMDELSDAPARPLDGFEREALAKLRGGEDLIVQEAAPQMRMLGSIRAVQQCLDCHSVQRGELLGAFSYRLASDESPSK